MQANSLLTDSSGLAWAARQPGTRRGAESASSADVVDSAGSTFAYTNLSGGVYTAPATSRNGLQQNADGSWTETQPNRFAMVYDSAGTLQRFQIGPATAGR